VARSRSHFSRRAGAAAAAAAAASARVTRVLTALCGGGKHSTRGASYNTLAAAAVHTETRTVSRTGGVARQWPRGGQSHPPIPSKKKL